MEAICLWQKSTKVGCCKRHTHTVTSTRAPAGTCTHTEWQPTWRWFSGLPIQQNINDFLLHVICWSPHPPKNLYRSWTLHKLWKQTHLENNFPVNLVKFCHSRKKILFLLLEEQSHSWSNIDRYLGFFDWEFFQTLICSSLLNLFAIPGQSWRELQSKWPS